MKKLKIFLRRGNNTVRFIFREVKGFLPLMRCLYARLFFSDKTLLVCGWIFEKNGRVLHNNWGDDVNIFFFSETTGKRVLVYPNTWLARLISLKNFVFIGSIINFSSQKNSVVWGSGLGNDMNGKKMSAIPKKILAVRGPLTRRWLISHGIACPDVYGDPVLLFPKFYVPRRLPRFRIGVIPHHVDIEKKNVIVERLVKYESVRLIRVKDYDNWRNFVDEICSCDFIISASLHGLIVSEAYRVPSLWVEFSKHEKGWDFKFRDFYESIGKGKIESFMVEENTPIEDIVEKLKDWVPAKINLERLLAACPVELKPIQL